MPEGIGLSSGWMSTGNGEIVGEGTGWVTGTGWVSGEVAGDGESSGGMARG